MNKVLLLCNSRTRHFVHVCSIVCARLVALTSAGLLGNTRLKDSPSIGWPVAAVWASVASYKPGPQL